MKKTLSSHHTALDMLWRPKALLAILCIGELIAAILSLAPINYFDRWVYFGLISLAIQWITILTLTCIYLLNPLLKTKSINFIAWSCLSIFVFNTFIFSFISWHLFQLNQSLLTQSVWGFAGQTTIIAFLIGLLSLAAFQNHMSAQLNALKSKQAQLDALHARIKPHFLFNTLNSLSVLIKKNPDQAEHLLFNLVDLFRAALSDETEVSLMAELAITKRYVEIESIRFGDRLKVDWQLPDVIPNVKLPALSLQPLVENAIKHGVSQYHEGGEIIIRVKCIDNQIVIQVCNSYLESIESVQTSGYKIGIINTKDRISLMSNGQNQLSTYFQNNQFIAEITIKSSFKF
ncbi:MAG: histidine kinase [Arenimonas sp.]|nr:histidine kinase [Arenimonas sp.]